MDLIWIFLRIIGLVFVFFCCVTYARYKSATLSNWWEAYIIGLFYWFIVVLIGYGMLALVEYIL